MPHDTWSAYRTRGDFKTAKAAMQRAEFHTPSEVTANASVVVCAYSLDRWLDLVAAVDSVRAQRHQPREIVVVIDRNDELFERAKASLKSASVISNELGGGISGARNTGVRHTTGDVLVFLDDDAVAEPDWLEQLLRPYRDVDVLGVGGRVIPRWRDGRPHWFPDEFNWVVGCSYAGLPETEAPVRNPIGANLSVRRDVLASVGGFNGQMGRIAASGGGTVSGTADETELCIRASAGWPRGRWIYAPAARVHHVVPGSRLTWRFFVGRCRMEGRSKAALTRLAGPEQSLSSERAYLRTVLPRAVARELRAARRGEPGALGRAGAILGGVTITASEYVLGRLAFAKEPGAV